MSAAHSFTNDDLETLQKAAKILRVPVSQIPAALSSLPTAAAASHNTTAPNPLATIGLDTTESVTPNQLTAQTAGHGHVVHLRNADADNHQIHAPPRALNNSPRLSRDSSHSGNQQQARSECRALVSIDRPLQESTPFPGPKSPPLTNLNPFVDPLDLQIQGHRLDQHQQTAYFSASNGPVTTSTSQPIDSPAANVTNHVRAATAASPGANAVPGYGVGLSPTTAFQVLSSSISSFQDTNEHESGPSAIINSTGLRSDHVLLDAPFHQSGDFATGGEAGASSSSLLGDAMDQRFDFACDDSMNFDNILNSMSQYPGLPDMQWLDLFPMTPLADQHPDMVPLQNNIGPRPNHPFPLPTRQDPSTTNQPGPSRVRKPQAKRGRYQLDDRRQTALTRSIRGCIRCRMNRKRCLPDPENPKGPCLTCQKTIFNVFRLPCLRYKIVDSILFRTASNSAYEGRFPNVGPRYGNFHVSRVWAQDEIKVFEMTQDRGTILRFKVRQFEPDEEPATDSKGIGGKGRNMFAVPWALIDAETGLESLNVFIEESIERYVHAVVNKNSAISWNVFQIAGALASATEPNHFIRDVLRLWTACRLIEGGWRCSGTDTLGAERLGNPLRPAWWVSPPPFIDYQFASIVMHRLLPPLRQKVLKALEVLILANKAHNWFTIFLATFILLHNYELIMAHEVQFARKRKYQVRYVDMNLVRGALSGSKTLLAHFHYVCKGNFPFESDFDWDGRQNRRMAQLDQNQLEFVQEYARHVQRKSNLLKAANQTDQYEDEYWFISQLFETNWTPKETNEHPPPF